MEDSMPKLILESGVTNVITRVVITNISTGTEITTFDHASSGLEISMIANNESTWTDYLANSGTIETITTLGTYAAPTSGKVRFKHVGKGLYEIQSANARWAVSGARAVQMKVVGGSGMGSVWAEIQHHPVPANVLTSSAIDTKLDALSVGLIAGTVGSSSTTTVINVSSIASGLTVSDQVKGRIIIFNKDTTTAALRGQGAPILSSTTTSITLDAGNALTTSPASGDTFTIF
jgi:hypothetical protein